jgi:1-acyl-sn-glycerol-3-phosphate acyltransferase
MHRLARFIFFKLMGWRLEGEFPRLDQFVVAVVPHTSSMDFIIGVLTRAVLREEINFIGKKELFNPWTGWFFKAMGGRPVDRSGNRNNVENIAALFNAHKVLRLALAPEGTRKKVNALRTGFYHIAHKAGVPILPVGFDFKNRRVIFFQTLTPSDSIERDFEILENHFDGIQGKIPENSFRKS